MKNLVKDIIIANGKTKTIYQTLYQNVVAFKQKSGSVLANGTSVLDVDESVANSLIEYLYKQNHNMFELLNKLRFKTTYLGCKDQFLFHEKCVPLSLEFVYRGALCNGSSIIKREPKQYGTLDKNTQVYSTEEADSRFFNKDGTVIMFKKPILETFHKKSLVQTAGGSADLISEGEAKKNPRYWNNDKMTEFMHEDPILITPKHDDNQWYVYNQKQPVNRAPLAMIDRAEMKLYDANGKFVRDMESSECISKKMENILQKETLQIMQVIDLACRNSIFKESPMHDEETGKMTQGNSGFAVVIDGKLEYGYTDDGYKLTDDLVSDNMRLAINGVPSMSLKRMFQNYKGISHKMMVADMIARGTENWTKPEFIKTIKEKMARTH